MNHVVGANRRYTMLLHGATADEVDATRTADHLGDDPVASFVATTAELTAAFREPGAMARMAHHPAGERTGAQLLEMRVLDVTVHTWDLARSIGADESLDPDAVAFALTLRDTFEAGRERGSFAPPTGETPADSSRPSPPAPPVGTTAQRLDAIRHGDDVAPVTEPSDHLRSPTHEGATTCTFDIGLRASCCRVCW